MVWLVALVDDETGQCYVYREDSRDDLVEGEWSRPFSVGCASGLVECFEQSNVNIPEMQVDRVIVRSGNKLILEM